MEIAVFLAMMIVPFISIAALVLAVVNNGKVKALKNLVLQSMRKDSDREKRDSLREFQVMDI